MTTRKSENKFKTFSLETRIMPSTFNEEKRTVQISWTTGQRGLRYSYGQRKVYEELDVSKKAVRMDFLKSGNAPLLDAHQSWSNRAVIGVVENAKLVKGEGTATVRFSTDEEADKIFRKVKEGVLRGISVGYKVHNYDRIEEDENNIVMRATDWEPKELSIVPIGFDDTATVRSESADEYFNCGIFERDVFMPKKVEPKVDEGTVVVEENRSDNKPQPVVKPEPKVDENQVREDTLKAERKRISEITEACRVGGVDASEFINKGVSVEECRKLVMEEMAKRQEPTQVNNTVNIEQGKTEGEKNRSGLLNALQFRVGNTGLTNVQTELDDNGKRFANMSLLDMARISVGDRDFSMTKSQLAARAFHSTSDFPLILEDTVRKTLRSAYDALPVTFEPFTRRTTTPDFKQISRNRLSDADGLIETPEGGEYKAGSISEEGEKYRVKKYGRLFQFTREMLINDDLDAFSQLPTKFGRAAKRLESDLVWAIITGNPLMADGVNLFHADHGNLGTGGALSETTISELRKLMRLQKDIRGEELNISPVHIAVPAALETTLNKLLTAIQPDSTTNVNPFSYLKPIVEPRLDAVSATAYYAFGSLMMTDMIELATLEGEGLSIDREDHMKTDSISWRVRNEVGVAPIDFRGMSKNVGA